LSTLTKVFVVLLVVFSIAFTVMTVSIVAQSTDWRDTAMKYEEHARIADTNLSNLIAANAAELAAANDALRSRLDKIAELEAQLQEARNDVARIRGELARTASEKSSSDAIQRGLLAQLDACAAGRDGYRAQGEKLEKRNIELERKNIDLNDRVNEYTAQIAVMLEQKRQLEQQVNIVRSENEKLTRQARRLSSGMTLEESAGAAMTKVTAATPIAATAIRGQVLEVSGSIVTISVGAADGVQKDMVFVIHRDEQYVGDLKINLVDPNQSAGRLLSSTASPRSGDLVTDAARMGGSRG
jgi:TolA-binding protein